MCWRERDISNYVDDVAYVIAAANVDDAVDDAIVDVDHAAIFVDIVADVALPVSGAAPPKAY